VAHATALAGTPANAARDARDSAPVPARDVASEVPFDPVFRLADSAHSEEISGIVFGVDGAPAARVEVDVVRMAAAGYPGLFDREFDTASRTVGHVQTDEHGAFALRVDAGRDYELLARDAAGSIARAEACASGLHVTLRLAKPATWTVRVMLRSTRAPLAGFTLQARRDRSFPLPQFGTVVRVLSAATTDTEGRAVLDALTPGVVELWLAPSTATLAIGSLRVQAGETRAFDVWVDGDVATVSGNVLDSAAHAVAGAEIARDVEFRDGWRADQAGHFVIPRILVQGDPVELFARAPGFGLGLGSAVAAQPPGRELSCNMRMPPKVDLHGRFVDAQGAPVSGVNVAVVESPAWQQGALVRELRRGTSREDGTFEVADLIASRWRMLVAIKDGFALCLRALPDQPHGSPAYDVHDITLRAPSILSGTVITASQQPSARTLLCFQGNPHERDLLLAGPGHEPMPETMITGVWTDALGRYSIASIEEGTYALYATNIYAGLRTMTLDLPRDRLASSWKIQMPIMARRGELLAPKTSGTIEGTALFADGTPCAGAVVTLLPDDPNVTRPRSTSLFEPEDPTQRMPITTFTDERGVFRFDDVAPSCPELLVQRWAGIEGQSALLARRVLEPETAADLSRVVVMPVIAVHGRVVDPTAPPGRTWLVRASSTLHAFATACVESDAEGRFTFYLEENGTMTISALPLNDDAVQLKSAPESAARTATVVENLTATRNEILIRIPQAR
jgi:hypothetical protein